MAELAVADVTAFTGGRLPSTAIPTAEVQKMLDAALKVARREAGWPVSPSVTETIVVDGPDSRILYLPTRRLTTLTSLKEDGVTVDLTKVTWSRGENPGLMDRPVAVRKKSGGWWSADYGAIEVAMTHGYTEAEAADWRHAILSMIDQMSLIPVKATIGASEFGLKSKQVDDVEYGWANPYMAMAQEVVYSVSSIIDDYRLPRVEFM